LPAALANPNIPDCCQEVHKNTPARQIVNCINSILKYNCLVDIWFIGMFAVIIAVINSTGKKPIYSTQQQTKSLPGMHLANPDMLIQSSKFYFLS